MEKAKETLEKIEPPFFLNKDTSNEHAKKIPFLSLGIGKWSLNPVKEVYVATILSRDLSGNQAICKR